MTGSRSPIEILREWVAEDLERRARQAEKEAEELGRERARLDGWSV